MLQTKKGLEAEKNQGSAQSSNAEFISGKKLPGVPKGSKDEEAMNMEMGIGY